MEGTRNEMLVRVGRGTPMGELLRRYWHPIAGASELDDTPIKAMRLMGEDLVDWCSTTANVSGLHPELQAEISFGLANSENLAIKVFVELACALLDHTQDWPDAE